ncbi:hypothetical protein NC651_035931 [Populus alba x Populus x berolinensis]|nr:hypothetical protein NC651_035931 [Populus alba x Populus x berolinensis]
MGLRKVQEKALKAFQLGRSRRKRAEKKFPCSKDPITSVTEAFIADTPTMINLGVGACRDDEGKPVILRCVREAGAKITGCDFLGTGRESVSSAVGSKLVAGSVKSKHCCPESPMYLPDPTWSKQVCLVSSVISQHGVPPRGIVPHGFRWVLSLKRRLAMREVSLVLYKQPRPSSPNQCGLMASSHSYHKIWRDALVPERTYHYYHPDSKGLNFAALLDDVKIVHFSYSTLTLTTQLEFSTEEQWRGISYHFKLIMPELDAQSIRIFVEDGHLIGCVQSFVKNMGLYGHRVGCLKHKKIMANRIQSLRTTLLESLEQLGSSLSWEHVTNQVGMFCLSCLTPEEVDRLAFIEKQQKSNHGLLLKQLKLKEPSYCNWVKHQKV